MKKIVLIVLAVIAVSCTDDFDENESLDNFFVTNMLSYYGCGCREGEFSFSDRCWPRYDCNANVRYTMPHRWVPTN